MTCPTSETPELSVVMPCLNEAATLGSCIDKAMRYMAAHNICGEVVIGDNGSTDLSREIGERHGARVVSIPQRGYGHALHGAISAARGTYVIIGDSDDSYDFNNLGPFLEKLRGGYEMVIGNRFRGGIEPGAMPFLHEYLGNPVLSFAGRLLFGSKIGDFHCGLRGFRRDAFERLDMQTTGMEFASEMIVKATLLPLKMTEVPTPLFRDGRPGPPHLRTWRDGWRHLRFLTVYKLAHLKWLPEPGAEKSRAYLPEDISATPDRA